MASTRVDHRGGGRGPAAGVRAVRRGLPGQLGFCGANLQRAAEHVAGRFARPSKTRKVGGSSAPRAQAKQLGGVGRFRTQRFPGPLPGKKTEPRRCTSRSPAASKQLAAGLPPATCACQLAHAMHRCAVNDEGSECKNSSPGVGVSAEAFGRGFCHGLGEETGLTCSGSSVVGIAAKPSGSFALIVARHEAPSPFPRE